MSDLPRALAFCRDCGRWVGLAHSRQECLAAMYQPAVTTEPPETFGSGVMTPVPNQPKTPQRSFRIPDDVYEAAKVKAAAKGETVTDVVVRALKRYGRKS